MMRRAALFAIFTIGAGNDGVSLLQSVARKASMDADSRLTGAVPFDWAEGGLTDLVSNTLTSKDLGEQEMRWGDVGVAHKASGDVSMDLVIKCLDGYKSNARTSDNGRHVKGGYGFTEFGRIFVRINMANRFKFTLVEHGTDAPVNITNFDFVVLDMDQACNDPSCYCDEEVIVWGAAGYYTVPDAYSDFSATSSNYESGPSGIVACSDVTVNDGYVTDPSSVKTLSAGEAKASIVFHFANTYEWEVGFAVKEHGPRALVFGGSVNPLGGVYHVREEVVWEDEVLPGHGMAYEWKLDREANVTANNLGGRGPNFDDPHEIRFAEVGSLYVPEARGEVMLDLVVYTEDKYWGSDYINTHWNGANGEYGEIGLSRQSEATIMFTFVETGTYRPRVVPFFDFTIFDIDNMANPLDGEEYTVFGASGYAALDNCFTQIDDSIPGETKLTSWVTENDGSIENPTSWLDLTPLQQRAAVQFQFFDTATWKVHFKITATAERAFLFGGQSRPPLTRVGTTKMVQTAAPTAAPTASPTPPSGAGTVYGDPHVMNIGGEAFDINRATSHTFLVVPRAADAASLKLRVVGHVTPRGNLCTGQLYLTNLTVTGQWLGRAQRLELFTEGEGFQTKESTGLRIGRSDSMSIEEFVDRMPLHMAKVTAYKPEQPVMLNNHVTVLLVRLYLGPTILRVSWEHQKEKTGFSNSLMLLTYGLAGVEGGVGGILGSDDHKWASSSPEECFRDGRGEKLLVATDRCHVRASAFMGIEELPNDES